MTNANLPEPEFVDDDNDGLHDNCPRCGREYDEIDREFQICHHCKHNAQPFKNGVQKFIACAKHFRTSEQMQKLQAINFFTKAEIRDGLKRYIHLKYIECI